MKRKLMCLTALVTAGLLAASVYAESGLADVADGVGGNEAFTASEPAGNSFEKGSLAEPSSSLYGEGEDALNQSFAAESQAEGMQVVSCPEMGFSLQCMPGYATTYDDDEGVTIYTENEGYIPYVMVYSSGDVLDPFEYIDEMFTPHIIEQYGSDLISYDEYENYEVGGKQVAAGIYSYFLQGYTIDLIRIYDVIDGRGVSFTAKYIQDEREATLNALNLAVASFVSDPYHYDNGGTLPQSEGTQPEGPRAEEPQSEERQPGEPEGTNADNSETEQGPKASENTAGVVGYHNDIKGFSFSCPEGISVRTSEYGSTIINLDDSGYPFILASYNDWSNDGKSYLGTISKNALEGKTIVNEPVGPSPVEGNPGMYALMYSFMEAGGEIRVTCFTEEFDNGFMYFEARYYPDSDPELISNVLAVLLSSAQPD